MTTYMPLDCDGFAAELADYLEGDAPDAVRAAMEAHAAGCAECRQLLEDIGDHPRRGGGAAGARRPRATCGPASPSASMRR